MRIDAKGLKDIIEGFERVEDIDDIIILGSKGGVRRITFTEDDINRNE